MPPPRRPLRARAAFLLPASAVDGSLHSCRRMAGRVSDGHASPGPVIWQRVCDALRPRIGERNFATWVAPLRSRWTDGALALEAPDRTTLDRVARHFLGLIEGALVEAA